MQLTIKENTEGMLALSLERRNGCISLVGNGWRIIDIKEDGTFERCRNIGAEIGLKLDNKLRIKETEEK